MTTERTKNNQWSLFYRYFLSSCHFAYVTLKCELKMAVIVFAIWRQSCMGLRLILLTYKFKIIVSLKKKIFNGNKNICNGIYFLRPVLIGYFETHQISIEHRWVPPVNRFCVICHKNVCLKKIRKKQLKLFDFQYLK